MQLGEDPAAARAAMERAVADAAARDPWLSDHRPRVTWPGGQFASGRLNDDDPLIAQTSAAIVHAGGQDPLITAAPYGSDLRLLIGVGGIPTLQFGPGDVWFAHAPREQVPLSETFSVARALLVLAMRRCGAH